MRRLARIDAGALFVDGVERDAADRGFGRLLDRHLGLDSAVPVRRHEAAFGVERADELLPRIDGRNHRIAERPGLVEDALLDFVHQRCHAVDQPLLRYDLLFERVAAHQFDRAVFQIARAERQPYRHAFEFVFGELEARTDIVARVDLDAQSACAEFGGDYAKQSAVVPMSESMMYMDKDKWDSTIAESDVYTQDYDKVKECLAKSKYPDGFEFDFYTTSQTQKQAELLKSMVDASGSITMNLVEVPDSDIFSYMFGYKTKDNGERYYNAVGTYMMSDFLDPMGMLKTLYAGSNACEGGTNETLWSSTEADGLLDKAAQTTDDAEKMGYYTDAYKIFADQCPYLGLYTSSDVYAVSDKFTYDPSPMFWYNFSYADVHVAK